MIIRFLLFVLLNLFFVQIHSQSIEEMNRGVVMHGKLVENNQRFQGVRLIQLGLEQKALVQAQINLDTFALELPQNLPSGVYKLLFLGGGEQKEEVLFILEDQANDIVLELDLSNGESLVSFFNSPENEKWHTYKKNEQKVVFKHEVLFSFINNYPEKDGKIVLLAMEEIEKERQKIEKQRKSFIQNNKGTWAALIVESQPYFFYDPLLDRAESRKKEHESFWSQINTAEPKLINSPIYVEHIIRYIRYYLDQAEDLDPKILEEKLKESVDEIMVQFSKNEETQAFAFEFLMNGFREIGQERVLQYLEENYSHIADQCLDDIDKLAYEKRMQGYAKLKQGMPAPDIDFSFEQKLSEIEADTIALVFWSTECPHCMQMIPKVDQWANEQKNIKVIGASLDTNYEQFTQVAQKLPNMMHHADGLGWNAPIVQAFYISATPTLILIDSNKKIIDKFDGFEKMVSFIK